MADEYEYVMQGKLYKISEGSKRDPKAYVLLLLFSRIFHYLFIKAGKLMQYTWVIYQMVREGGIVGYDYERSFGKVFSYLGGGEISYLGEGSPPTTGGKLVKISCLEMV